MHPPSTAAEHHAAEQVSRGRPSHQALVNGVHLALNVVEEIARNNRGHGPNMPAAAIFADAAPVREHPANGGGTPVRRLARLDAEALHEAGYGVDRFAFLAPTENLADDLRLSFNDARLAALDGEAVAEVPTVRSARLQFLIPADSTSLQDQLALKPRDCGQDQ